MAGARARAEFVGWQWVLSLFLAAGGRSVVKAEFLPLVPLKNAGSPRVVSQRSHDGEGTWTPRQITAGLNQGWLYRCEHRFPYPLPARG